jgi:hypothetical protein
MMEDWVIGWYANDRVWRSYEYIGRFMHLPLTCHMWQVHEPHAENTTAVGSEGIFHLAAWFGAGCGVELWRRESFRTYSAIRVSRVRLNCSHFATTVVYWLRELLKAFGKI